MLTEKRSMIGFLKYSHTLKIAFLLLIGILQSSISRSQCPTPATDPTVAKVDNTLCVGTNASITITAPLSLANYTFSIDGGKTFSAQTSFTALTAGNYSVVSKEVATGCQSKGVIVTILNAPAALGAPTFATPVNPTSCVAPNGSISVNSAAYTGTNLSLHEFSIDGGKTWQASNTFNNLAAGTYSVIVKRLATSCTSTAGTITLTIALPAAPTTTVVNNSNCVTPNGTITVSDAVYTGTNLANFSFSKDDGVTWQSSNIFTALDAGTYNVRVKNNASGCRRRRAQLAEKQAC